MRPSVVLFHSIFKGVMMTPQALDEWKILPRIMMAVITLLTYQVIHWFMALDIPTTQQTTLVSICTGMLTGSFGIWMNGEK